MSDSTLVIGEGASDRQYWRDIWRYRDLVYVLALRDILVRYKQTAIGVAWSVVRPVLTMIVLSWVFGRSASLRTPNAHIPYSLWVFAATLPWQFFSDGLTASSNSLVNGAQMISKIYFPRLIMPVSRIIVCFVDFAISFAIFSLMMGVYHFSPYQFVPSWRLVFIPVFLALTFVASAGMGVWFAALNVKYRDFTYLVPFLVTFGLYVSPVGLSTGDFTHNAPMLRCLFSLNPMVGVIDGFRWCVFGEAASLYLPGFCVSLAMIVVLLWAGIGYFRRSEKSFADLI